MEIESAWHSEGRRMASRAAWLRSESADRFEKMSPVALQKIHGDGGGDGDGQNNSSSSREQSQDDDRDDVDHLSEL